MRALGLIKIGDIQHTALKDILVDMIKFFAEYDIDIKPYIAVREYEYSLEVLSINIDKMVKKSDNNFGRNLRKMGVFAVHSYEKREALLELICSKFFKGNKNISNNDDYRIDSIKVMDDYDTYCTTAFGPYGSDENKDDSISTQFQSGMYSVCSFQIELITNELAYASKETTGINAIQNIWNMLENDEINDFQAAICLKPFYESAEVKYNGDLMYGDGETLINTMLENMKA